MRHFVRGTLLTHFKDYDVIIFSINMSITKNGNNVMGKGVGKILSEYISDLPRIFGGVRHLTKPAPMAMPFNEKLLVGMPTKVNWYDEENLDLVKEGIANVNLFVKPDQYALMEFPLLDRDPASARYQRVRELLMEGLNDNIDVLI
jgi:hypothetical protein